MYTVVSSAKDKILKSHIVEINKVEIRRDSNVACVCHIAVSICFEHPSHLLTYFFLERLPEHSKRTSACTLAVYNKAQIISNY